MGAPLQLRAGWTSEQRVMYVLHVWLFSRVCLRIGWWASLPMAHWLHATAHAAQRVVRLRLGPLLVEAHRP